MPRGELLLSHDAVKPQPLSLGQAPVGDVLKGGVTDPPRRIRAHVVPHEDLRIDELFELLRCHRFIQRLDGR